MWELNSNHLKEQALFKKQLSFLFSKLILREFHTTYFNHIHPLPQTPPRSTHYSIPIQIWVCLLSKFINSNLKCPYAAAGYVAIHLSVCDMLEPYLQRKLSQSSYQLPIEIAHLSSTCWEFVWPQVLCIQSPSFLQLHKTHQVLNHSECTWIWPDIWTRSPHPVL